MADRAKPRLSLPGIKGVGPVQMARDDTGEGFRQLSNSLFRMSSRIEKRLDTEAQVQAARDGTSGDVHHDLMFQPTLRGQAYTKSATQAYSQQIDAQAREGFDRLSAQHWKDPAALAGALDTYMGGIASDMPADLKPAMIGHLQDLARPLVHAARKQMVQHEAMAVKGRNEAAERGFHLDVQRYSRMLLSDDEEVRSSAAVALSRLESQMAARYEATVSDDLGRETPIYKPSEFATAHEAFQVMVAEHSVQGWYNAQGNKLQALREWRAGNLRSNIVDESGEVVGEFDPGTVLTDDEKEKMTQWMRSTISAELSIQAQVEARADRARQRRDDALLVAALIAPNDERDAHLDVLITTSSDPDTIAKARKIRSRGLDTDTWANVETEVLEGIADGRVRRPGDLPVDGLSRDDRATFAKFLIGRASASHITNLPGYRDAENLLHLEVTGTNKTGFVALMQAGKGRNQEEIARLELQLLRAAITADRDDAQDTFDPRSFAQSLLSRRQEVKDQRDKANAALRKLEDEEGKIRMRIRRSGITEQAKQNAHPEVADVMRQKLDVLETLEALKQ